MPRPTRSSSSASALGSSSANVETDPMDTGENTSSTNGKLNEPRRTSRSTTRQFGSDISNNAPAPSGRNGGRGLPPAAPKPAASVAPHQARTSAAPQTRRVDHEVSNPPAATSSDSSSTTAPAPRSRSRSASRNVVPSARAANDIDARDVNEPLAITEYVEDLYVHLRSEEVVTSLDAAALSKQPEINAQMRAILVDWLVEVHLKFKLVPDTLFLTVYVIDKYLSQAPVAKGDLQLVGVTALLLASKYEEIYPPEIRDLVYITDKAYTKEQILRMESKILVSLGFQVTVPTTYCFLLRYLKAAHADKRIVQLSCYIAERMLQEQCMLKYLPSTVASCAIYIARMNLNRNPWSVTLEKYTSYKEEDLLSGIQDIENVFRQRPDLVAVERKFSSQRFGSIAKADLRFSL